MASLCSPGEPVLALDVDRRTVNHLWFQDLITKGLVRVRSTPQPCNCLNAQTMTSDVARRRAAGSGITNSGESQTSLSAGSPDFHSWRNYDARNNPYRAGSANWGSSQPHTGPSSNHDPGLLRHQADPGGTCPSGDASGHSNPQTHSPHRRCREADRSTRLSSDWRGAGGVRRLIGWDADVRRDGPELRLRRLPFRDRLAEQP